MRSVTAWLSANTWIASWGRFILSVIVLGGAGVIALAVIFLDQLTAALTTRTPVWLALAIVAGGLLLAAASVRLTRGRRSTGRARRPPVEIRDGEITWVAVPQTSYAGATPPRPECTEHRIELMARYPPAPYPGAKEAIERIPRPEAGTYPRAWVPYCVEGKHDVEVSDDHDFHQAETIAVKLIEAEQRQRQSAG